MQPWGPPTPLGSAAGPTMVNVSLQAGAAFHMGSPGQLPYTPRTFLDAVPRWDPHLGVVLDANGAVVAPPSARAPLALPAPAPTPVAAT
eukprot:1745470-Alexandrium_andersonii.AAC.1